MISLLLLLFSIPGNLVLVLVIISVFIRLACKVIVVQGESMLPTLADGDHILICDWWPRRFLWKGQIVVSKTLPTVFQELRVKRIIATANTTVSISLRDIRQPVPLQNSDMYHDEHGQRIWHIPPQHVFVRGDNYLHSLDSVSHGPLPYDSIHGVVLMKLPCTFLLFSRRNR